MKLLIATLLLILFSAFAVTQHLPLTLLAQDRLPEQIDVERIEGTLTHGSLQKLQVSPLPWVIQTAGWVLQPSSLMSLQPTAKLYARSWNQAGNSSLNGLVSYNLLDQVTTLSHIDMKLELAQLAHPFHLPVMGAMILSIDSLMLRPDGCQSATGAITLSQLRSDRLNWLNPLSPQVGSLSCQDGKLVFNMQMRDPQINAAVELALTLQGEYQLTLDIWGMEKRLYQKVSNALGTEPNGVYNLQYQGELFF